MEDTNHPPDVRDLRAGRPLLGRHWPRKQQPKEEGRTKCVRSSYSMMFSWWALGSGLFVFCRAWVENRRKSRENERRGCHGKGGGV